jgi:hypothetical protein
LILKQLSDLVCDANFVELRRFCDERDDLRRSATLAVEDGQEIGLAFLHVDEGRQLNVLVGVGVVREQEGLSRTRFAQ